MGLSSKTSKTTQTNKPIYSSELTGAANNLNSVYAAQAPKISGIADRYLGVAGDLIDDYRAGNPAIDAAQNYITSTLSGDPAQNPQLEAMIAQTGDSVAQRTNASLGTRGLAGGSVAAKILSRQLAENETGLRYTDYNNEMQRRAQAAGMAPGVVAGQYLPLSAALQTGQTGALLPTQAAAANAAGIGGLLGQYQTVNGTQKQGSSFLDVLGTGIQAAGLVFSDARLKTDVRRVGSTDGGLGVFTYRYNGQGPYHMGVMAQEVEVSQPESLGPRVGGFRTVNYAGVS